MSKFFDKLILMMDVDANVDSYKKVYCDTTICNFCGVTAQKLYNAYLYDEKVITKACYLCRLICNFSKSYIGQAILVASEMEQHEINKTFLEYYNKHGKIPTPSKLDKKCRLINMSLFRFAQYDPETKKNLYNFKIMFTNTIQSHMNNDQEKSNMFVNTSSTKRGEPIDRHSIDQFDAPKYELSRKEREIIDNMTIKPDPEIIKIKKSLDDKLRYIQLKSDIKESLMSNLSK